ncbi:MAG TPA: AAA family ATPase [Coriobacteriia bacterium]|nr:AAA family ATPase [Coriobacteriia bacterium]
MAGLGIISLEDVATTEMEWLWPGWIPKGALTFLVGDPGVGKSSLSWDLAARLSTGDDLPDGGEGRSGRALIISGEDGLSDWIRPQLIAYGARIDNISAMNMRSQERGLRLDTDCEELERLVDKKNIELVIIDPLDAFLGRSNPNSGADIRAITNGLAGLAQRTGAAVLVLHHFNKKEKAAAGHRVSGSIDLVGAARSVLYLVVHRRKNTHRILYRQKGNCGRAPQPMLLGLGKGERLEWSQTPDDFDLDTYATGRRSAAVAEAVRFLKTIMDEHNGCVESSVVLREAAAAGISRHALERAKDELCVSSRKSKSKFKGGWAYCYEEDEES